MGRFLGPSVLSVTLYLEIHYNDSGETFQTDAMTNPEKNPISCKKKRLMGVFTDIMRNITYYFHREHPPESTVVSGDAQGVVFRL